jgi:site-specific DNA recombinase
MKRAALYARVSTRRQEEEETIATQLVELRDRIAADGHLLLEECVYTDDGWTGELLARPALDRLREDARRGLFELLYVYDRGRLARKFVYQEIVLEELANAGLQFVTLHDFQAETPEEQVLQAMQGVFHEYERVKITERMRAGKLHKVKSGLLLGFNPPYGYDYQPRTQKENGAFRINEAEARVVRLIFGWVGEEGISIREVIRRLYRLGIPPRQGKRPTWTTGPISRLLREEAYTGIHYYNRREAIVARNQRENGPRYRKVKKTGRRRRPRSEWLPVAIPALIPRPLFDQVQQQLRLNAERSPRNTQREYLLRGLIYCPCGQRRSAEGKERHRYYRCNDRLHRFPLPRQCTRGGVCAPVADAAVWNALAELLADPGRLREQAERWLAEREQADTARTTAVNRLEAARQKLQTEEERYAHAYGEGVLSFEAYRSLGEQVASRRRRLEAEALQNLPPGSGGETGPVLSVAPLVVGTGATLEGLDFADRRAVVTQLVEKVVADSEAVLIRGQIPVGEGRKGDLRSNNDHRQNATLPFALTVSLPAPDIGGRGYSTGYLGQIPL